MVYFYPVLKAYDELHDPETAYDHHKSKDKVDPQWLYFQRCKANMDPEIVAICDNLEFGSYANGEEFVVKRPRDYLELYCCLHWLKHRRHFRGALMPNQADAAAIVADIKAKNEARFGVPPEAHSGRPPTGVEAYMEFKGVRFSYPRNPEVACRCPDGKHYHGTIACPCQTYEAIKTPEVFGPDMRHTEFCPYTPNKYWDGRDDA